jgi:hypothetical protein
MLESPVLVCKARGTGVTLYERQRHKESGVKGGKESV